MPHSSESFFGFVASGSSGNCFYINTNNGAVIIDAGISFKQLNERLASARIDAGSIRAILITHAHADHIKGASVISRKLKVPILATAPVVQQLLSETEAGRNRGYYGVETISPAQSLQVAGIEFHPFAVPHDAKGAVAFGFEIDGQRSAVVTDLGKMPARLMQYIRQVRVLFLEANHDVGMLMSGHYPERLKERILGENGHLSNRQTATIARSLINARAEISQLVLAHLSEHNNTPISAATTVRTAIEEAGGKDVGIDIARRYEMSVLYRPDGTVFLAE